MPKGWGGGYIQPEITEEIDGIKWDGSEKFYNAVEAVNTVILTMQDKFPDFALEGELQAQGEEFDDKWILAIEDGIAIKKDIPKPTDIITCRHCDERFSISEARPT